MELVLVCPFFFFLLLDYIDVVSSVPAPSGRSGKTFSTYLIAQLLHAGSDLEWRSKTVKTQHTVGEGADVMWQSKFEWEYDIDDMAFLRFVHFIYE